MYKVLVLWSGGVDSTTLLKFHLEQSDCEVHAHHIKLLDRGGMINKQLDAVQSIEPMLQKIRPFNLTESVQYASVLGDVFICLVDGMRIAYRKEYDEVAVGFTKTDESDEDSPKNLKTLYSVVEACNENDVYTNHKIKLTTPIKNFTKEMCWDRLGKELQEKVWWCREGEICGKCFQCREMDKINK